MSRNPSKFQIQHPQVYDLLCEAMVKHDMASLMGFGCPPDEYSPEVEQLVKRLAEIDKISTLDKILFDIFVKMFSRRIAGTPSAYTPLSTDIFTILKSNGLI